MNANTDIAGYLYEGQYFCPTCVGHVEVHESRILRPGLALDYTKRKCAGTNCGKTVVFRPIEGGPWGRKLEPFAQFVNELDF